MTSMRFHKHNSRDVHNNGTPKSSSNDLMRPVHPLVSFFLLVDLLFSPLDTCHIACHTAPAHMSGKKCVSQESVPIEQGQPRRAVEPDEWAMKMRAKPILETLLQRQRDNHELTHLPPVPWCPACVSGKAADNLHRRWQDAGDSGLDVASLDHCDISAEVGMFNKKLRFKISVSHRSGAVATLEGPKDVRETWRYVVCVLKCQNEPAEIALQNVVVRTSQFKTCP